MTQNSINSSNPVLQVISASNPEVVTCNTAIPADNSIPQNTEGNEVLTVTITPQYTTSLLQIDFIGLINGGGGANLTRQIALFQDTTAGALAAISHSYGSASSRAGRLQYFMTSGTTSATTFKVRVGPGADTIYTNALSNGNRIMGGVSNMTLTVTEYRA